MSFISRVRDLLHPATRAVDSPSLSSIRNDPDRLAESVGGTWDRRPDSSWKLEALTSLQEVVARPERVHGPLLAYVRNSKRDIPKLNASTINPARVALITSRTAPSLDTSSAVLRVDNLPPALNAIAAKCRDEFTGKVVAVTGSVGKTTVRAMLAHVLEDDHTVFKGTNNHNGLLTLRRQAVSLHNEEFATFEVARIALPGAERILSPDIVLVTAIAEAHMETFGSMNETAEVKAQLLKGLSQHSAAIINADTPFSHILQLRAYEHTDNVVTYGELPEADLQLVSYDYDTGKTVVQLGEQQWSYRLQLAGKHNAINSLGVVAVLHSLGLPVDKHLEALNGFAPIEGRGKVITNQMNGHPVTLVDESFNANPTSMKAALESFGRRYQHQRRILILGDMLELGPQEAQLHEDLEQSVRAVGASHIYLVGTLMKSLWKQLPPSHETVHVSRPDELLDIVPGVACTGAAILVKASHSTGLGKLISSWR